MDRQSVQPARSDADLLTDAASAADDDAASAQQFVGGLRWAPAATYPPDKPHLITRSPRRVLVGAGGVLAALAVTGLALTLVSAAAPHPGAQRPLAMAVAPSRHAATPTVQPSPTFPLTLPTLPGMTFANTAGDSGPPTPAAPTTPAPTATPTPSPPPTPPATPPPTVPAPVPPTPRPTPSPTPTPCNRHHCPA